MRRRYTRPAALVLLSMASMCGYVLGGEGLKVGDRAPDFALPMATKDSLYPGGVRLADLIGKNTIILAFYPADWSGGCTKEMCSLRDSFHDLEGVGASVYGISGDYIYSHREWARYHQLQFPLLSDHDHHVAKLYQSYNEESGYNRRTVFVIDRNGTIAYIDLTYKPGENESLDKLRGAVAALK